MTVRFFPEFPRLQFMPSAVISMSKKGLRVVQPKLSKKDLQKIWEKVPPDYYERGIRGNAVQRLWHTKKFATFRKLVGGRKFKKILDVGCAGGNFANRVSTIFPESKITGIDVYTRAVRFARRHYPHIRFLKCDAHRLPFADGEFDCVLCYETIEHVLSPNQVLQEIYRCLDKKGLAVVTMDSGSLLFRLVWFFWEKTRGKAWQGAHLHPFHHSQLEAEIKQAGFKIAEKHFSHLGMEVSFVLKK